MESKYDYVVFDIETTGLHPDSDQICEIAAIGVKDGLPQGTFSTLVAIEGSMPEAAGRVNGITDDMLKGAPAIGDALDAFLDFIGDDAVLAGHNITSFDIPFMEAAAAKSGRASRVARYHLKECCCDTLMLARMMWPDASGHSMDCLRRVFGIERTDSHRALADCYDELAVFNAVMANLMYLLGKDDLMGDVSMDDICSYCANRS
ncbi:PolC-type DNA polymerase III [Thomasclavelia ramosa]|uniref:3'-5' exonuclease n=1 Tax=Thomasclavelia ramosa TaxID=1547 RepID=UPI00203033A4|nr:3'-5' exonuclease [Thomasclavelia ramosa]MCM1646209.1 3'-5' exonuclease [Thomasclavelia ramosa]